MKKFPFYRQQDTMDCGPTCLKMISKHFDKDISIQSLREFTHISREGVSINGIIKGAEKIGLRAITVEIPTLSDTEISLLKAPLPCIVHWDNKHFVIVYKITKTNVWIADPASGKHKIPIAEFKKYFETSGIGFAIILEPTPLFYETTFTKEPELDYKFLFKYFKPYRKYIVQLFIGMAASILLQLAFPFLTQSIVDMGISTKDKSVVVILLLGQLVVFVISTFVNVIQRWIMLHVNTRISVQLIYDFLNKLMKLPIAVFDSKHIGDLYQRIQDNKRVEAFLSASLIPFIQAVITFIAFGILLAIYNTQLFIVYIIGLLVYLSWIILFMKKRKTIDFLRFQQSSLNQSSILELLRGMHEIKLQNSQYKRRLEWLNIQSKLFYTNIKGLEITNYQDVGAQSINRFKDIVIVYICAVEVIDGGMTLGMFLAVQYIIGQLNAPLQQMIGIIRSSQDAYLSLQRMNELYSSDSEAKNESNLDIIPTYDSIEINNLFFRYNELSNNVLQNINFVIPKNKTTAIVGASGSGKTTLIKLLLGFYDPSEGNILLGNSNLRNISKHEWRDRCGAVMQEGYIFSDTIANNIAESDDRINKEKLIRSSEIANIADFIYSLPLKYNTQIGARGNGISNGQRQRILIARAVYKNPEILFFDEATNALDTKNEKEIVEKLEQFTKDKTVIVVAHRLSTVKNADKIIVLDKGIKVEEGTHSSLVEKKGYYYELVKNQLELGE